MSSLYVKVKEKLDSPVGVLSDSEALLINRKNYSLGEASPQGAFLNLVSINVGLQDSDLLSYVYSLVKGISHDSLNIIVESKSVLVMALYAALLEYNLSKKLFIDSKYDLADNSRENKGGNFWADFLSFIEKASNKKNRDSIKSLTLIFVDALDVQQMISAAEKFNHARNRTILIARNLSHKNCKYIEYPYLKKNVAPYFSSMGFGVYLKI